MFESLTIYDYQFWMLWALILFAQQFSFLFSSRAKNSGSMFYSALAGLGSHGTWFIAQMIFVVSILQFREASLSMKVQGLFFYIACCTSGTVAAQYIALLYERGSAKVGAGRAGKTFNPRSASPGEKLDRVFDWKRT